MKLKVGDNVKVLVGKDKGKIGKIMTVFPKVGKVLVENINQYKRHIKGRMQGQKSEIVTITKPMVTASVALVCAKCNKVTRVGYRIEKENKIRFCRKCDKAI